MPLFVDLSDDAQWEAWLELERMSREQKYQDDSVLVEIKAEGKREQLLFQMQFKFCPLPAWARKRIVKATPAALRLLAINILNHDTLEGVMGKRTVAAAPRLRSAR